LTDRFVFINVSGLKKIHPLFLSLLSGLLLFACWPLSGLTSLVFIALVPLFWLAEQVPKRGAFFAWTYLALLVWNAATTWWTCNSTLPGGLAAIAANALLMSVPWIGFYNVRRRMGNLWGQLAFIVFWLCFEYIHLNWELSWPWLTLGNVFATHPAWVQWYEYTGEGGGTLWVLLINAMVFYWLKKNSKVQTQNFRYGLVLALAILIPLACSFFLSHIRGAQQGATAESEPTRNIVVVQPNVDPWDEKFVAGKQEAQLQNLIRLSESKIDSNTALVVWPETAIPFALNEDSIKTNYFILPVWDFLKRHPSLDLLTGVEGFRFYRAQNKTSSAERIPGSETYVDGYNSAVLMDSSDFRVYHKSKLVPGAEVLPSFLKFLDGLFEKFGGTTGGYATQKERTVLHTFNHSYSIAPAVCYESIYGEFMTRYIAKGANLIVVLTDDGWWGNTPGYKQHENYARLRAIETRRWVVRSANTGISCFIDPMGAVIDPQPWDKAVAIKKPVPVTRTITFYVSYGDLIYKLGVALSILLGIWNLTLVARTFKKSG
jgi:apolipoprotein N-acyltransferase